MSAVSRLSRSPIDLLTLVCEVLEMEDMSVVCAEHTDRVIDAVLRGAGSLRVTNMPTKQGACDTEHKMEVWERTTGLLRVHVPDACA